MYVTLEIVSSFYIFLVKNLRVLNDFSGFRTHYHCNPSGENRAASYGQTNRYEKDNRQISQPLCSYTYNNFTELSKASSGTHNLYQKWALYDALQLSGQ